MTRSQATPALEVDFPMPEVVELQAAARMLLKARPLDPAAILDLVHQVRANVVWALEQAEVEATLAHSDDVPDAWQTLETKREAFATLSKRMFMPVAMGWRTELFARAALAELDATAGDDEPPLTVDEVIIKFYTVNAESPQAHQLGMVYTEGQLDELDLLRRTVRRIATDLRRLSSREEVQASLAYVSRRRPGLIALTHGWIKSGLAFGEKVERAIAADENDSLPPSPRRDHRRPSVAASPSRTRSPALPRSGNSGGPGADEMMDEDDQEPGAPGPSSQRGARQKAPRLANPLVRPPSTELEPHASSRAKRSAADNALLATAGPSRIPPRDPSPAESHTSKHSQSQAPRSSQTFAVVVPFRNRLKDAARSEQARLAVKPPVPAGFDPIKAAHIFAPPPAPDTTSRSRTTVSSSAPGSKPSKGKGRPSASDEANTSGNTTTSSALEPPPPYQRMRSPESSGAIPKGDESQEAAGDPTPEEGSSLEQPETVADTQSDEDDEDLPREPGDGQFGKLDKEATEEVDDASEVGRLADETDRDVESF